MELVLFLAAVFLVTFVIGRLLEKIRIPWIFSALLIGLGLAAYNPFQQVTSSPEFELLSRLGMYFLLFIIGFELNVNEVLKSKRFIGKVTFAIILSEAILGSLLVHFIFGTPLIVAVLLATSFATVGEAVLLPILDEFNLIKTKFGQTIIGVGVLDDVIEVVTVIAVSVLLGRYLGHPHFNIWVNLVILAGLFGLVFVLSKLGKYIKSFKYKEIPSLFLFVIFFFFLFIGIGTFVESAALGALLAGIAIRNIIPHKLLKFVDSEIKTMAYGLFAPVFFLWVGIDVNIPYLIKYPLLILLFMAVIKGAKVISSYLVGRKELGSKKSILLGVSLCVKFSTSIVIIKLLFEHGLIGSAVYSVFIGTKILFKFVIPLLLSYLITHWNLKFRRIKNLPG